MSNFGAKPPLEQDQLSGSWAVSSGRSYKVESDERIMAEASLPDRQDMSRDAERCGRCRGTCLASRALLLAYQGVVLF